jgi:hypothetical protein
MADITDDMHTHDLSDPPGGYGYVYYPCASCDEGNPEDVLSAIDLREVMYEELGWGGKVETARIVMVDEESGRLLTSSGEALYVHSTERIGIAWGAGADWADAESLAEGIRVYCEDPDLFESRN